MDCLAGEVVPETEEALSLPLASKYLSTYSEQKMGAEFGGRVKAIDHMHKQLAVTFKL